MELSVKYDEKFLCFMASGAVAGEHYRLYLPIDTTQKSGALFCKNYGVQFTCGADFVIDLNGKTDSRVVVQERNDVLRAMYLQETEGLAPL